MIFKQKQRHAPRTASPVHRGQALVEMAFLLPLLVIIIGATLSFGLFFFQANVLQQAVDVTAQEIARMPFSPTAELGLGDLEADTTTVMYDEAFQTQIYDEKYLIIHDEEWADYETFHDYIDTLPLLNRLLAPVMVRDLTYANGVTRFPGAIVTNNNTKNETVLIPIIEYDADGNESLIEWVAPVEEIRIDHDEDPNTRSVGPFSVIKPVGFQKSNVEDSFTPGMVALRINYPAQSTTLINRTGAEGEVIVEADDSTLGDGNTGSNYSLAIPAEGGPADTTIHSGRFGLGRQAALLVETGVRPYRKVMSVQAIYRREVFQ